MVKIIYIIVDHSQRIDKSLDAVLDIACHDFAGIVEVDDTVSIGVAEK